MLDLRFVRDNPDLVRNACTRKRIDADVDAVLEKDAAIRELRQTFEAKKAEQNRISKEIGKLQGDAKAQALAGMKEMAAAVKEAEGELKEAEASLRPLLMQLPQIPDDVVPEGATDEDNVELRRTGEPPTFDFEPKDHVELGDDASG